MLLTGRGRDGDGPWRPARGPDRRCCPEGHTALDRVAEHVVRDPVQSFGEAGGNHEHSDTRRDGGSRGKQRATRTFYNYARYNHAGFGPGGITPCRTASAEAGPPPASSAELWPPRSRLRMRRPVENEQRAARELTSNWGDDRHLLGAQRNAGIPVMWCPITRVCTSSVPS